MKHTIPEELEIIKKKNKNLLKPEAVVDYARKNPKSSLHSCFEWDDSAAAEKYRIFQARNIIRVNVTVLTPPGTHRLVEVSAYVSLPDNRGRGYETMVDVINDPERSRVLLIETIRRLQQISEVMLYKELDGVREAIERVAELYLPTEEPPEPPTPREGTQKRKRILETA